MKLRVPVQVHRRGIASIEFTVIIAFLLLLLRGIWEVGRLIQLQSIVTNAAREGARRASSGLATEQEVEDAIKDYLQRNGLDTTGVSYSVENLSQTDNNDPETAEQLDHFQVVVTMPFNDDRRWVVVARVLSKEQIVARADWYSMRDVPVTIDPDAPSD